MNNLSLLFSVLALFILSCQNKDSGEADLIIHNAMIYTVDDNKSSYEALAVKNGLIQALGSSDEILSMAGDSTQLLDAEGSFVMPGFIEGHGHFSGLGQSLMNLNFLRSKSWDDIIAMVEEKIRTAEKGEWIVGRGWHQEKWEHSPQDHIHGYPRHFDLSAISKDNPVMLIHASGHGLFANETAMKLAGVTKETPDPRGGEIVRDENGNAIGMFEERAQAIIREAYGEYLKGISNEKRTEEWYEGIELAQNECLKYGVTSFQDAGSSFTEVERYKGLADNGGMRVRLWAMIRESSANLRDKVGAYRILNAGGGHFTCRAVKVSLDGALGSFGAWLLESYEDKEDFFGQNTTEVPEVEALAEICNNSGMQFCVHAIGDRANRETLDIFEKEYNKSANKDLRWRVEHAQHLHPADIPRFGQLGVIASMQGIHCTSDAPFVEKRLGFQRAQEGAYNWRALLDSGAVVTNGTDVPVEDINPFESLYASVTRKRADTGLEFFPENAMSREEAIYSYTRACAYAAFEENEKGSLEKGKYADIVILSNNLLDCNAEDILQTEVIHTLVGGKIMYSRPE